MAESFRRMLFSTGILLIIVVVSIILYVPLGVIGWSMILPMILALYGVWLMVLSGVKARNPQQYDRGPFSTFSWGLLLVALGGAWFVSGYSWLYSLLVILVVFAVLAIAVALKRK